MTRNSEHQGSIVMERDGVYTSGYRARCGSCDWTADDARDRGETALRDLLDHIQTSDKGDSA